MPWTPHITKPCWASTTRPVHEEIFSQTKPTMSRSDLNNIHGLIDQDTRASGMAAGFILEMIFILCIAAIHNSMVRARVSPFA